MDRQSYWSLAHLWQDHSSHSGHRQDSFPLPVIDAPQVGRPEPEKERFYDQLQKTVAKIPATEILIPVSDWNSHIDASVDGFSDAHSIHNRDGQRILEFAISNGLHIRNTWCKKRDTHLITYSYGGDSIQINYILYRKGFCSAVSNVKIIPNKVCVKQHCMVVCDFSALFPQLLPACSSRPSRQKSWLLQLLLPPLLVQMLKLQMRGVSLVKA